MRTELVWLALLMGAVTYPWRAIPLLVPGMHRLPAGVRTYLRFVGPAILAALAALNTIVVTDAARHTELHVGIEWVAVGACVLLVAVRGSLLLGLLAAAGIAAFARALG